MDSQPPLSLVLQSARMDMIKATNEVMGSYGLPPCLMDGILSELIADIRAQSAAALVKEIKENSNFRGDS